MAGRSIVRTVRGDGDTIVLDLTQQPARADVLNSRVL